MSEMIERPDYLVSTEVQDLGTENLNEFIRPPRMKIVQKQSDSDLIEEFGIGSIIAVPQNEMIAPRGVEIPVVPLYFYPEWITCNPIELRGKEPMVRYRTQDRSDPIVSKSRNADTWEEEIDGVLCRHVECLNFVCCIDDERSPLYQTPIVVSFSKAEHNTGSTLAAKVKMRQAPMMSCRFGFTTSERSNNFGTWYGFDVRNVQPAFVNQEAFEFYKALYGQFKEADVQVDYEDPTESATSF